MTSDSHSLDTSVCTVAVDVGNSAVKLCVRTSESKQQAAAGASTCHDSLIQHSIRIDQSNWPETAIAWVRSHAQCGKTRWRIASVQRDAVAQLGRSISRDRGDEPIRHITAKDIPLKICVHEPDRVGIDRLLGAYAAWNCHHEAVVVVDAGSAITVDWVCDDGCFQGGAILPGLNLQTRSLATGTDALPEISWHLAVDAASTEKNRLAPAKNTVDAIRLGVLTGASAAIDRLAQNYHLGAQNSDSKSKSDREGTIVLTGGDAAIISPHLHGRHDVVSNLVCRGLLDLPEP